MARHIGVRYQYASEALTDESTASQRSLLPTEPARIEEIKSQLQAQPADWTEAFHRSVLGAREQQIQQLILQLPKGPLAESLQICLEQLRFDLLQQIIAP